MSPNHSLSVPLDLLRRLAELARDAAKLLEDRGEVEAAWSAQQIATEADAVAMSALERGQIRG